MKVLLKEVFDQRQDLKGISSTIRNEVPSNYNQIQIAVSLELVETKVDQVLVWPDQEHPNFYILFKGKVRKSLYPVEDQYLEDNDRKDMDMITFSETFKELKPLSVFGSIRTLQKLNQNLQQRLLLKPWQPCYVYVTEPDTYLLQVKYEVLVMLQNKQEGLNIANEVIQCIDPKVMAKISGNKQKALAGSFYEKIFNRGQTILEEGQPINTVYLVKEGECKIISTKMPIYNRKLRFNKNQQLFQKDLLQNKSYFSKTTNSYQLGLIQSKEWIGDEVRNFNEKPIPYSIIALSTVKTFAISRDDFLQNIPKDVTPYFEDMASNKCKWLERRFKEIARSINKLQDNYFVNLTEQTQEVQRKYPSARSVCLNNFRNKQLLDLEGQKQTFMFEQKIKEMQDKEDTLNQSKTKDLTQTDILALTTILGGNLRIGTDVVKPQRAVSQTTFNTSQLRDGLRSSTQTSVHFQTGNLSRMMSPHQIQEEPSIIDQSRVQTQPTTLRRIPEQSSNLVTANMVPSPSTGFFQKRIDSQNRHLMKSQSTSQFALSLSPSLGMKEPEMRQSLVSHFGQPSFLSNNQSSSILPMPTKNMSGSNVGQSYLKAQNTITLQSDSVQDLNPSIITTQEDLVNIKPPKPMMRSIANNHLLLFCSTPLGQKAQTQHQQHRLMHNAATFSPIRNLVPRVNSKADGERKRVKATDIQSIKQNIKDQHSKEEYQGLQQEVAKQNKAFYIGNKQIQLINSRIVGMYK